MQPTENEIITMTVQMNRTLFTDYWRSGAKITLMFFS